jgi:hypothetical protein
LNQILAAATIFGGFPRVVFMSISGPFDKVFSSGAFGVREFAVAVVENSLDFVLRFSINYSWEWWWYNIRSGVERPKERDMEDWVNF